jgi:hypothetical protein
MAIGFSLGEQWQQQTPEGATGMPSFYDALHEGIMNIGKHAESRAKPKMLSEDLLAKQLSNRINRIKGDYEERNQIANLNSVNAGTGLTSQNTLKQRILNQFLPQREQSEIRGLDIDARYKNTLANQLNNALNQENTINDLLANNSQGAGNNSLKQNINSSMQGGEKSIVETGNPELYNLDEMYDNYPQLRKKLEERGIKGSQEVKFDPKTGITTTINRKPSGKVVVTQSGGSDGEFSQNTNAIKTANQKTINSIVNARPIIKKLIKDTKSGNVPGQMIGQYFSPDRQAAYMSDVIQSGDTLAGAFNYPNTEGGLNQAKATVLRQPRETDAGYIKRLKSLLKDMDARELNAKSVLNKGTNKKPVAQIDTSKYDLPEGSVILYKKGVGYAFPQELVREKLDKGYTYE